MAQEAATTIVLRMRDEATPKMQQFSGTMQQAQIQSLQLGVALTAMGGALTAIGSLLNQIDNPTAKMAATFLTISGAVLATAAAIGASIGPIRSLIKILREWAALQTFIVALTGPLGLATIAAAVGVTAGVFVGLNTFTSPPTTDIRSERTRRIEISGGPVVLNDDAAMRRFTDQVNSSQTIINRGR